MKKLELNQMENLEGGVSACGWMSIAGGVLAIALLATPAGMIYAGAAAGYTLLGGLGTAASASLSVAGIGCGLAD